MLFAKSTGGFYDRAIHGDDFPADAVEITAEKHAALLQGQSEGKRIVADENGFPLLQAPPMPTLDELKSKLCLAIDATADAARLTVVGDPLRVVEYERAAAEAQGFADAGYVGAVPLSVKSWAEAKDWTGQQAADDILAASAQWNSLMYSIRDVRLKAKEEVKSAADAITAQSIADAVIIQIKAAVGAPA